MARFFADLILLAVIARADPPVGYYAAAEGLSGPALKAQLRLIIDEQTVIPYADLFPALRAIWEDPQDSTKLLLIYGEASAPKTATTWNREHLWPRSRGVNPSTANDGGPDDSDLFHVVPADSNVNSARSNLYYDMSRVEDGNYRDPAHVEAPLCTRDSNSWQPPPTKRGDIARALFYMATRYDGTEPSTSDLELVTASPTDAQMANLATLLAWHLADPPDAAERARNDLIFSTYQHNRNPFIDRPEWVEAIWGSVTGAPSAQITASARNAYEAPGLPVTFAVTLNTAAPAGGATFNYTVTGTATAGSDYSLSGTTLNTATQAITIPEGATSASFTLTPVADATKEAPETFQIVLNPRTGYDIIGGPALVGVLDEQTLPQGVLAYWNFDTNPHPVNIPATTGTGTVKTGTWTGSIQSFTGVSGQSLALEGSAGNNSYIDFVFSTAGWTNLRAGFSTRGNDTGSFTSGTWSWSNDGVQFTTLAGINTVANGSVYVSRALDLSAIPGLQNQASVTLRYKLSGATQSMANNRIDDFTVTGHRYSEGWLTRFPALTGTAADPLADPDGDTLDNFQEWALDRNPLAQSGNPAAALGAVIAPDPAENDTPKLWPCITFVRRTDTPRLQVFPQESFELKTWTGDPVLVSTAPGPSPQSETVTYRSSIPAGIIPVFFRLRVSEE